MESILLVLFRLFFGIGVGALIVMVYGLVNKRYEIGQVGVYVLASCCFIIEIIIVAWFTI